MSQNVIWDHCEIWISLHLCSAGTVLQSASHSFHNEETAEAAIPRAGTRVLPFKLWAEHVNSQDWCVCICVCACVWFLISCVLLNKTLNFDIPEFLVPKNERVRLAMI